MPAMRSSADALADSATHGTTVVDPGVPSPFPEPIAPWTDATFRDLESESRQRPMDLRLRMRLWWLSSMTVLDHLIPHRVIPAHSKFSVAVIYAPDRNTRG